MTLPPSLAEVDAMARSAFEALPQEVRRACEGLAIRVEDFADQEMLDDLEIDDPFSLTGLYDGTALTERSVFDQPTRPDTVWLFRRAILDEWVDRGDVELARISHQG